MKERARAKINIKKKKSFFPGRTGTMGNVSQELLPVEKCEVT